MIGYVKSGEVAVEFSEFLVDLSEVFVVGAYDDAQRLSVEFGVLFVVEENRLYFGVAEVGRWVDFLDLLTDCCYFLLQFSDFLCVLEEGLFELLGFGGVSFG